MANAISFTSPYDTELDALKRREALALAMQQQSDAPLSGTMAGGRIYVPPSWAQGAAKLAQAWAAKRGMSKVDERRTAIANERQQKLIDALTRAREPGADPAGVLMGNPDTAAAGVSIWQNQVSAEAAAKAARDLEEFKQGGRLDLQRLKNEQPMTPYQQASLAQQERLRQAQMGQTAALAELARGSRVVKVDDPNSPSGSRYVAAPEAAGMPAPRVGGAKLNATQLTKAKDKLIQVSAIKQQLEDLKAKSELLKNTFSAGPFGLGKIPTEVGAQYDAAVDALRNTIRQISRTPGEGAMSDYESKLASLQLPDRNAYESVRQQKEQQIEDLVAAVEAGYRDMIGENAASPPQGQGAPAVRSGQAGGGSVMDEADAIIGGGQ